MNGRIIIGASMLAVGFAAGMMNSIEANADGVGNIAPAPSTTAPTDQKAEEKKPVGRSGAFGALPPGL